MTGSMRDRIAKTAQTGKTAQTVIPAGTGQTGETRPENARSSVPFKRPNGRASFPRRMTLDLDHARFDWLRREAYESRVPAAELLRAAISLMQDDPELRQRVVGKAEREHPAP